MAPAADMFELGVEVQVLRRGTMFGTRGRKLHDYYTTYASLDEIPSDERKKLEERVLGITVEEAWADTHRFWSARDPREVTRAEADPRHKMALLFRWYLGNASKWAIDGAADRVSDYQIWCGPAMGAFNTWTKQSFLEDPQNRTVVQIAKNLMEGAAVVTRAQQVRSFGVAVPHVAFNYRPRPLQ
jgi:PfaD family protein